MKVVDNLLEGKVILRTREDIERKLALLTKRLMFSWGGG